MKAITIKQPWASLIAWGVKDVENRTWRTNFRGRVLIHAGAQWYQNKNKPSTILLTEEQRCLMPDRRHISAMFYNDLPLSAIIGEVEIVDCVKNYPSVWAIDGHWHWVLKNAVLYPEPIPSKGALSFWTPSNDVLKIVKEHQEKAHQSL